MSQTDPLITEFAPPDRPWAVTVLTEAFGAPVVVSRGVLHGPLTLPGFVARTRGDRVGLVTYRVVLRV
jgi:hypothetical protein